MLKYKELTEVKEILEKKGIKYKERRFNGVILLYINGLMQIDKPKKKDLERFWPEVRISLHEGDSGYCVKACGMTYMNQTLGSVMKHIWNWV